MRTGAIFARGSCRALKWMALVGVVIALGAGEALAQKLSVSTSGTVPEGANRVPVTVRLEAPAATGNRSETVTVTLTLTPRPDDVEDRGKEAELGTGGDAAWADGETGQTVDASTGTVAITFTSVGNSVYTRTETAYLNIGTDDDAEDEELVITSTSASTNTDANAITPSGTDVKVKIDDAQTQRYTLLPKNFGTNNTIEEGGHIELELKADPARTVDVTFRVELSSEHDDSDYGLGSLNSESEDVLMQGTVADDTEDPGNGTAAVTLYSEDNDVDRVDDTVTLTTTHRGDTDLRGDQAAPPLEIAVLDKNKLPKISRDEDIEVSDAEGKKSDVTMLMEGQKGTVTLMADRSGSGVPDSEDITVELSLGAGSTANAQDYRLEPSKVTLSGSATSGTFEVDVLRDEDVGPEMLVLMATVSGDEDNGDETMEEMLDAIDLVDATTKKIEPKTPDEVHAAIDKARAEGAGDNGLWNSGEMMTLMAEDLFDWPETTTSVVLSNAISEDQQIATAATSNDSLMITAVSGGMTEISVTATVIGESSGVAATQTVSNVATVKFPVTVDASAITAMPQTDVDAAVAAAIREAADMDPNKRWEPGGATAMVPLSELFDVPEALSPSYLAESSDESDVMAAISGDMHVNLTPVGAGTATIMVTAVDTDSGSTASVSFDATVMEKWAIRGRMQAEVDAVFEAAGADDLIAQGPSVTVDMSELFDFGNTTDRTLTYSADSSDMDVLVTSVTGMMLTLTPGTDPAGGMSTITVRGDSTRTAGGGSYATVEYMATVDKLPPVLMITSDPMDMVEEGGAITVTATLNQEAPHDKSIAVQVTGPATPKEAEIMLMEGMESASVMLMADDDYDPMSDWNDIVVVVSHEAIMGGSGVLTLSVTENDSEITYTLSGPDDMNLVEGEEYELTVMAEPAVPMDTEVTIMRDRAASDADEDDYTVDPIMIMAGETSGSAMLMVEDDGPGDAGHGDPEELTLYGMVGNMQTNSVSFNLWDAAVPALPVIAQLLLAALMAIGGYRRYRRR